MTSSQDDLAATTPADLVVRAMTDDGAFRAMAVRTSDTVAAVVAAQEAGGDTAQRLGELITGAVLIREATVPGRRVQLIYKGPAGGRLVADSHPDGTCRGLVNPGSDRGVDVNADARLHVMYTLATDALHQGIVAAPRAGGIPGALMAYMQTSEQVVTTIGAVAQASGPASGGPGAGWSAGGYLIQMLPGASHDALARMTRQLEGAPPLDEILRGADTTAHAVLAAILGDVPHAVLERRGVRFGCHCSRERMLAGLASLPASDTEELASAEEALELRCDVCGQRYAITPDEVRNTAASQKASASASLTPGDGSSTA